MFVQLGKMVFNAAFTPSSWSLAGDEANYAEHELINGKPRLQKVGVRLQEIALDFHLRVDFCNPTATIQKLKDSKDAGEVLSLIGANGRYWGDYVIISMPYGVNKMFSDSTIMDATVSVTLKEYVAFSKLEMLQQQARKEAFAVGVQKPVVTRSPQGLNQYGLVAKQLSGAAMQINAISNDVAIYNDNVSRQAKLAADIQNAATKTKTYLDNAESEMQQAEKVKAKATGVINAIATTRNRIAAIVAVVPPTSINDLLDANNNLQSSVNVLNTASTNIFIPVAIRRDNNVKNG